MNQFAPILPEMIVTIGAIALMMVAAFAGRRSTAFVSWAAVATLIAATVALAGAPSNAPVPAELTVISLTPRSLSARRISASAMGLRQVLPVQTKRIFMVRASLRPGAIPPGEWRHPE